MRRALQPVVRAQLRLGGGAQGGVDDAPVEVQQRRRPRGIVQQSLELPVIAIAAGDSGKALRT